MVASLKSQHLRRETALPPSYLTSLGFRPGSDAAEFFSAYSGPFCSRNTGFILLDLGRPDKPESVEYSTRAVRSKFGWPDRYLVISDLLANSVFVYDTVTESVFNVDFEGGDAMLISGTLPADFPTFTAFLEWYFQGEC